MLGALSPSLAHCIIPRCTDFNHQLSLHHRPLAISSAMFLKTLLRLLLVGAAASACASPATTANGCSKALPDGQEPGNVYKVTIPSGDDPDRYVLISVPPRYSAGSKTSAILSFHGGRKTAQDQLDLDLLTSTNFNSDKFVIYPQGIDVSYLGFPFFFHNTNWYLELVARRTRRRCRRCRLHHCHSRSPPRYILH